MRFCAEWEKEGRKMTVGDVILQRAVMPPIGFGFCLEFAVRICAAFTKKSSVWALPTRPFLATLRGIEFYFEQKKGELFFTIHTFSGAGPLDLAHRAAFLHLAVSGMVHPPRTCPCSPPLS